MIQAIPDFLQRNKVTACLRMPSSSIVSITNVPLESAENELFRMLASFGEVLMLRRTDQGSADDPHSKTSCGLSASFQVEYEAEEDAEACAGNMNGMLVKDRYLVVEVLPR
jgi:hypothetical protein